jgi:hypothetical protein
VLSLYCRFIERRLPLFVGGDLGLRWTRLVRGHVQRCGPCAASYQSFRRAYVALHRAGDAREPAAVSDEFWPELRRRLRGDRRGPARGAASRRRLLIVSRVAVAAGVLAAFGTGFLLGDPKLVPSIRGGAGPAEVGDVARPQATWLPPDFGEPVNHVTHRNVDSYYLGETRVVAPKGARLDDSRSAPLVPLRTSVTEEEHDFR